MSLGSPTSRRNVIRLAGGTAAAAVAFCALVPVAVQATTDPDAPLVALEKDYWETTGALCEADNAYSEALFALRPDCPECLYYTGAFFEDGREEMRKLTFVSRAEIDTHFARSGQLGTDKHRETLAAWDQREAESEAAENDPHVVELRRKTDALSARVDDIREQIFAFAAAGPAGMAVKLRLATGALWEPHLRDKFRNGECEDMEEAGALSALLDCERLATA